ncbi:MAG: hypothetical protein ACRDYY_13695 [Acidimicrobiales bacterium]
MAGGIGINVTLLFSDAHYLQTADAYIRALERRSVPPPTSWWAETVIDTPARGLVVDDPEVVRFATSGSTCPVERRWLYPAALGTQGSAGAQRYHVRAVYPGLIGEVNLLHDHASRTLVTLEWAPL